MRSIFLSILLAFSTSVFAEQSKVTAINFEQSDRKNIPDEFKDFDEHFYTIFEVRVKQIAPTQPIPPSLPGPQIPERGQRPFPTGAVPSSGGDVIAKVDRLIAVGMKIWKMVDQGRPVVTNGLKDNFSVLPYVENGTLNFEDMTSWQMPVIHSYKVEYVNGYGMTVISFDYKVSYLYGGKYQEKGSYLAGLSVRASNISVMWGFDFEAQSELLSIVNHGDSEDPMAGAMVEIGYRAKSIFKDISSSTAFHVTGDGKLEVLY